MTLESNYIHSYIKALFMNLSSMQLIVGIACIQKRISPTDIITAIQFEDGSGNKFNYQLDGDAGDEWRFVDLSVPLDEETRTMSELVGMENITG